MPVQNAQDQTGRIEEESPANLLAALDGYVVLVRTQVGRFLVFIAVGVLLSTWTWPSGDTAGRWPSSWNVFALALALVAGLFDLSRMRRVVRKVRSGEMLRDELLHEVGQVGSSVERWLTRKTFPGDPNHWWPWIGILQGVAIAMVIHLMLNLAPQ